jgi:PAS domain S-box-containing protein
MEPLEAARIEEAAADLDDPWRSLVDAATDYAIFLLDRDGCVLTWSAGAKALKGYAADEIVGRHFSVFYPPEDVAAGKPERELAEAREAGGVEDEGWRVRKDGSRFWANVVIRAVRGRSGAIEGFAKVTRDLTARVRAEAERARRLAAEEAVQARDVFLGLMAHELRTPVAALKLQVDALERATRSAEAGGEPPRVSDRLAAAQRQLARLAALVERMLDVSRLTGEDVAPEREPCDLVDVARAAIDGVADALAASGCRVELHAQAPLPGAWDRRRVEHVLANLLHNAAKFGAGKPIEVTLLERGPGAVIEVRDRGIGIAAEDQARVFERFERAVSARHFGGFGVGLWVARQLVRSMGGELGVASAPGQGATFTVSLPRQ